LAETERNPALKAGVRILTNFANTARGDFVEARRDWEQQFALFRELGQTYRALSALSLRARIEKSAGELELAAEYLRESCEGLEREALAMIEETDQLEAQGVAFLTLGNVLESAGRKEEALAAIEESVRRFERKGLIVSAEKAQARLAEVTA